MDDNDNENGIGIFWLVVTLIVILLAMWADGAKLN